LFVQWKLLSEKEEKVMTELKMVDTNSVRPWLSAPQPQLPDEQGAPKSNNTSERNAIGTERELFVRLI